LGGGPDVIAGQADVFPTKRCDMGEKIVGNCRALGTQVPDSPVKIDCVPVNDGGLACSFVEIAW